MKLASHVLRAVVLSVEQGLHNPVQYHASIAALVQTQGTAANLAMVRNHQAAIVFYLA